jgi:8-oxo-dGTP diphosphatase
LSYPEPVAKHAGLVPSAQMAWAQAIILKLAYIEDGAGAIREPTHRKYRKHRRVGRKRDAGTKGASKLMEAPAPSRRLLLVAACALVDPDRRVLITQRPAGKPLAGLWEFPGGKVEEGETPEATLIRELREELGVTVTAPCLAPLTFASHDYGEFHLLMPLFVCRRWEGIPAPREAQQLKWVRPNRLRDFPMPPADEPLISHLVDLL